MELVVIFLNQRLKTPFISMLFQYYHDIGHLSILHKKMGTYLVRTRRSLNELHRYVRNEFLGTLMT